MKKNHAMRLISWLCLGVLLILILPLAGCSMISLPGYNNSNSGPPYTVTYMNTTVNTTGSVPVDATPYASGATVTVKGNTGNLSWPGFTFDGWNTKNNGGIDGGGGGVFYAPGATFMITSNVVLYGQWH